MAEYKLDISLIDCAVSFLSGKTRITPLEHSSLLSELLQVPVYLKMEFLQITGSFKLRGAFFYLSTLSENQKRKGVAACSAGNHGLGIAFAAKELEIPCTIYVPKHADKAKQEKIAKLGATVIVSDFIGYDDTLAWAQKQAEASRYHFVTAYNDERIMAANGGTLAVEIFNELPDVQNVIVPVGGAGLSAGLAYYLKSKNPKMRIIGCQHVESPALKLSLEQGAAVTYLPAIETLAGGVEGGIGEKSFNVLKKLIDDVILVSEQEIIDGLIWMLKTHQFLIEPTAAVAVACCLSPQLKKLEGLTVVVLTGRNVSYKTLQKLLCT